jgi:hypothetical protein
MACDPQLSTRIASFATVAGGFGHPSKGEPWKSCTPARLPIPMLSIHGDEDRVLPYLLNEWEPARSRLAVPTWLDEWSERNGCGEAASEPLEATDGTGTEVRVTKLDGGGWSSEGEAFRGGAMRIAKSCPRNKQQKANINIPTAAKEEDKDEDASDNEKGASEEEKADVIAESKKRKVKEEILSSNPKDFTILHYRVRNYGHGWPTLQIKGSKTTELKERFFDATALVLDWFKIHELPIEWAGADEAEEKLSEEKKQKKIKNEKEGGANKATDDKVTEKKEDGEKKEADKMPLGLTEDDEDEENFVDDVEEKVDEKVVEKEKTEEKEKDEL